MSDIKEKIDSLVEKYKEKCLEYYLHLHQNPEKSREEKETSAFVAKVLSTLPLDDVRTNVGGYGVLATLKGGDGPCIGLRADMDALEVTEATGAPFASKKQGLMHACGHDSHTAMLLAVCHVLCDLKQELKGSVKFLFQPSEELTPHGGAKGMIAEGALENPHVDMVFGLHVWPGIETGTIGIQAGAVSAASDHIIAKIKGIPCHGSMPEKGRDAVLCTAAVIMNLQQVVSRNISASATAVVTIGHTEAGSRYNVVGGEGYIDGTVRSFTEETHEALQRHITRVINATAEAYDCKAEINYMVGYPPTVNDADLVEKARKVATSLGYAYGEEHPVPPTGEDFAFFAKARPSLFSHVGCRPHSVAKEDMPALHNDKFLPDQECFPVGVRYTASLVAEFLK